MGILGLLSIFLVLFLPGLCLIEFALPQARFRNDLWRWILAVVLSMLANFNFVFHATNLGIYGREATLLWTSAWSIFFVLLTLLRRENRPRILLLGAVSVSVTILLWLVNQHLAGGGRIHWEGDVIQSWNRWARDYAQGIHPRLSMEYPQMIPALWSLSYTMIGDSSVEFFARSIMPFFYALLALPMVALALSTRRAFFWIGALAVLALTVRVLHPFPGLASGLVEGPLACLALISVALLFQASASQEPERLHWTAMGVCAVAVTALTKQSGIVLAVLYPAFIFLAVYHPAKVPWRVSLRRTLVVALILLAVAGPFFLHLYLGIQKGKNRMIFAWVAENILSRHSSHRIAAALHQVAPNLKGILLAALGGVFLVLAMKDRVVRWLVPLWVLPWFALWAFFASYDKRNLAPIIPALGLCAAIGLETLVKLAGAPILGRIESRLPSEARATLPWPAKLGAPILLALIAVAIFIGSRHDASDLRRAQIEAKWKYVGDYRVINQGLSELRRKGALTGALVGNYPFLVHLPAIPGLKVEFRSSLTDSNAVPLIQGHLEREENVFLLVTAGHWAPDANTNHLPSFERLFPGARCRELEQGAHFRLYVMSAKRGAI